MPIAAASRTGQVRSLNELEFMEPIHSATIEFTRDNSNFRLELYLKRISRAGEVEITDDQTRFKL
ncbi:uncharacterized protein N7496_007801 [Penicillium cataractarum]|uniref:Uncharacterized protein n=1 Tax=Penicillium cataractarum TaxID=2100454 RepID=A0A9W9RX99_9EURO|nr:uncharacterized protein N7496_007801 [Penicillium cataractarum]KAJ5368041.1 hypothetical protein N7496_007801 [Penicillium cataractarum]